MGILKHPNRSNVTHFNVYKCTKCNDFQLLKMRIGSCAVIADSSCIGSSSSLSNYYKNSELYIKDLRKFFVYHVLMYASLV